jgi:hypothetical protein
MAVDAGECIQRLDDSNMWFIKAIMTGCMRYFYEVPGATAAAGDRSPHS